MKQLAKTNKYKVKKQIFFNWYFKNQSKEQISAFLSPYLLNLVNKDVKFSLEDLLNSTPTIPGSIVSNWKGATTQQINTKDVILIS